MFSYRLALALGYRHPNALLSELTDEEFNGWRAYWDHEPWGEDRADVRMLYHSNRVNAAWGSTLPYQERLEFPESILDCYRDPPMTVAEAKQLMAEMQARRDRRKQG